MPRKVGSPLKKIVVVGGSQGAVEALLQIVPSLPADLPAAIFVVVHMLAEGNSYLPRILSRLSPLMACHPKDGEAIRAGNVYVAPPDFHLTLQDHAVQVRRGPRENRHRPAIDPLFRTAARSFSHHAIAVLLSGNLDDGSAGMYAVRGRGGIGIIQDPEDAQAAEMPGRALKYAGADYVLPARAIAAKLVELISSREVAMKGRKKSKNAKNTILSDPQVRANEDATYPGQGNGEPSVFACPECHGVLWEVKEGKLKRFRCRVGHGYTEASLMSEMDQSTERALWAAMRALEEKAAMSRRLVSVAHGPKSYMQRLHEQMEADAGNAEIIRRMIFSNK